MAEVLCIKAVWLREIVEGRKKIEGRAGTVDRFARIEGGHVVFMCDDEDVSIERVDREWERGGADEGHDAEARAGRLSEEHHATNDDDASRRDRTTPEDQAWEATEECTQRRKQKEITKGERARARVAAVRHYPSLAAYLDGEGWRLCAPQLSGYEETLSAYRAIYPCEKVRERGGMVALELAEAEWINSAADE